MGLRFLREWSIVKSVFYIGYRKAKDAMKEHNKQAECDFFNWDMDTVKRVHSRMATNG